MSIAIVGIMLVAALNAVGASKATQRRVADRARATLLAQDLMAEILQQDYEEPGGSASLAADSGEDGGNRSDFDDVDDYHGWSSEPPQSADGTDYADLDGWQRQVEVLWVDPADFSQVKVSESGVKLITVTVSFRGAFVVSLSAVRTASAKYDME